MSATHQPLANKIAIITGGSRGLGRAMVHRFVADGARVFFSYRSNAEAADEVVRAVRAAGSEATAVQADLSSIAGVRTLFDAVDATLVSDGLEPQIDVLVNNAGIIDALRIEDVDEAAYDRIFDLNVKGVFFATQAAIPRLRHGGRIINLGTGLTRLLMPERVVYSAAKGAIDVLSGVLAQQLGERGITVNTLAPGPIDTDMNAGLRTAEGAAAVSGITALRRVGHAEDIADAAAFLASEDSRWITAQRIEASGGLRL